MRRAVLLGVLILFSLSFSAYGKTKHEKGDGLKVLGGDEVPVVSADQSRTSPKLHAKSQCQTVCYQELDENGDPMYDGQGNVMWDCRPDCPEGPDYQYNCAYSSYCTYVELCAHTPWGGTCSMTYGGGNTYVCGGC